MENNKALRYIISILLIVAFGLGGFYFGKRTAETENMAAEEPKPVNPAPDTKKPELMEAYSGNTTYSIYFRKDNTFRLREAGEGATDYVGTYEVKENTVTLKTVVMYSTNGCYFKEGAKAVESKVFAGFTGTIIDSAINLDFMGTPITLTYDSSLKEDNEALSTFVTTPVDGTYTDCTSNGKI